MAEFEKTISSSLEAEVVKRAEELASGGKTEGSFRKEGEDKFGKTLSVFIDTEPKSYLLTFAYTGENVNLAGKVIYLGTNAATA